MRIKMYRSKATGWPSVQFRNTGGGGLEGQPEGGGRLSCAKAARVRVSLFVFVVFWFIFPVIQPTPFHSLQ
uniref:Uncharacterized protein n=1 Tax=Anguilla anguilla TaxID=7936 RepID=A0A0E9TBX5_ANGAN